LAAWARDFEADLQRFLAKRRLVQSDIQDVCQEVYLRLLRFDRTEVIKNPAAYLFRVAANVAHDFRLRQAEWVALEEEHLQAPAGDPTPEESFEASLRHRRLMEILKRLPALPRAALTLQVREELSYEAIAERLGISHRAVKRAVLRGHAMVREALRKEAAP
jgi:RNA polymerase sigma-70 factor (ECF subfamily)